MSFESSSADRQSLIDAIAAPVEITDAAGVLVAVNAAAAQRFGADKDIGAPLAERLERRAMLTPEGLRLGASEHPATLALRERARVPGLRLVIETLTGPQPHMVTSGPLWHGSRLSGTVTLLHPLPETETERGKDEFIAALSHELRAPLQPILGWAEVLLRRGDLDEVVVRALDAIRRNIRQQVRLVDDLLDLSRIAQGTVTLRYERFDLRETVHAAAEPLEETAALQRVRLGIEVPPDAVDMWGDGSRVRQIVSSLVANAVRFTPAGGGVLVRVRVEDDAAVVDVEDSAHGIPRESLDMVLVRRLVAMHRGTLGFPAMPGGGGCVRVRLPLAGAPPGEPRARREVGPRLAGRAILVVEDNDDTRDVLKFMLELEGARVDAAATGADAVDLARRGRPDVVLCDIGLPDMDGLEVARRIRASADARPARLIALTGYGQADDVRRALAAGFDAHLTKPVNLDELLALLTRR